MKSLLQRLPSKEKEWKAVARAKEKFYGDAFAREAAVCRASLPGGGERARRCEALWRGRRRKRGRASGGSP
jgi:hypothetical protein